ncbi:MAG TPA: penicillin-binding transpeptidase domain-containing protein [Syntrophorhabdaceae bacterium]|jgi:peptidoglycan glycosyltransferase
MSWRLRIVAIALVACGFFLGHLLIDRMAINQKKYATSQYIDKRFVELVAGLGNAGAFTVHGRLVGINDEILGQKGLSRVTVEKVRQAVDSGAIYSARGQVAFNRQFCAKANPKKEEIIWRGGFFDRNGIPLARTTGNEKFSTMEREYLRGREFSPVIGHFNPVYGTRNLEKEMDGYLSGRAHDPVFHETDNPLKRIIVGDDITLTLDSDLQKYGYDRMTGAKGAIVVMDVRSGEVLAAVSAPSYDPNAKDRRVWEKVVRDGEEKLYENRAFSVLYPLGSTFKTVVMLAWLDSAGMGDHRHGFSVLCTGRRNAYNIADEYKEHGHGAVGLEKGFIQSCNPFFSELGVLMGPGVYHYAVKLGFMEPINLVPQIEGHGYYAMRSLAYSRYENRNGEMKLVTFSRQDFRRNKGIVAQCAIGQNQVTATPLQMAMVAAAAANGGKLLNPYVVREIRSGRGEVMMAAGEPVVMNDRVMNRETARIAKDLMRRVMTEGTGKKVKKIWYENGRFTTEPAGKNGTVVPVAGKTGTAETGRDELAHSWFIGFAPADNPKYAIAVIAENKGKGGAVAAPMAVDVLARALNGNNSRTTIASR